MSLSEYFPALLADAAAGLHVAQVIEERQREARRRALEERKRRRAKWEAEQAAEKAKLREEHPGGYHDFETPPPPTERLRFERLGPDGAEVIVGMFGGDESPHVDPRYKHRTYADEYVDWLRDDAPWSRKHGATDYVAYLREDGEAVGLFHVYDLSLERFLDAPYRATVGYHLREDARGRGLGREAVGALLRHVRDHFGRTRALAYSTSDNAASIGLLRALGFADSTADYDPERRYGRVYYTYYIPLIRRVLQPDEVPSAHAHYVALVPPEASAGEALEQSASSLNEALDRLSDEAFSTGFNPDKPTAAERVQHLLDFERACSYFALAAARRGRAESPGFSFAKSYRKRPPRYDYEREELLEELSAVRSTTRYLLRSLTEEDEVNVVLVDGETMSARAAAFVIAGYTLYQVEQMATADPG